MEKYDQRSSAKFLAKYGGLNFYDDDVKKTYTTELVRAVTGGGAISNANHLRTLSEEQRDRNKYRDVAY